MNDEFWPKRSYGIVASLVISLGILGTIAGEWLNVTVFAPWAYAEIMPIIPLLDVGLSPVAQWLAIPLAALRWSRGASSASCAENVVCSTATIQNI